MNLCVTLFAVPCNRNSLRRAPWMLSCGVFPPLRAFFRTFWRIFPGGCGCRPFSFGAAGNLLRPPRALLAPAESDASVRLVMQHRTASRKLFSISSRPSSKCSTNSGLGSSTILKASVSQKTNITAGRRESALRGTPRSRNCRLRVLLPPFKPANQRHTTRFIQSRLRSPRRL